jgi:hypothetical protein
LTTLCAKLLDEQKSLREELAVHKGATREGATVTARWRGGREARMPLTSIRRSEGRRHAPSIARCIDG